jgi:hypothetical protein
MYYSYNDKKWYTTPVEETTNIINAVALFNNSSYNE